MLLLEFSLWHRGLRTWPCCSCGIVCRCGLNFDSWPGNLYVLWVQPKKKKKMLLLIGHFHLPILTASRLWVQKVWERELLKYLFSFTGGSSSSPRDEAGCGFALKWCSCVLLVLIFFLTRAKLYSSEGIECSTTLGGRDDGGGGRGVHRDTASLSYSVWSSADALAVTRGLKTSLWCAALSRACEDMRRQPKKMLLLSNPQMTYY